MKNINEVTTKSFNQVFLITGDRREKRIESEERKQRKRFLKQVACQPSFVKRFRSSVGPETKVTA